MFRLSPSSSFFPCLKRPPPVPSYTGTAPSACGTWEQMIRRAHIGTILLPKSINLLWNFLGKQAVRVPAETNLS